MGKRLKIPRMHTWRRSKDVWSILRGSGLRETTPPQGDVISSINLGLPPAALISYSTLDEGARRCGKKQLTNLLNILRAIDPRAKPTCTSHPSRSAVNLRSTLSSLSRPNCCRFSVTISFLPRQPHQTESQWLPGVEVQPRGQEMVGQP
jgi:hypothetical protein